MNLIEQFGGYEKSKRELKLKEEGSMFQCCAAITAKMIRDALLQYRRENNIFEKGDLVVFKNSWTANNSVLMVDGDSKNSIRLDTVLDLNNHFRHATPQEIAQGYRDD